MTSAHPTVKLTSEQLPPALQFTESAAHKVWELLLDENNTTLCLRVFITGGGCSGFQYGFTFDDVIQADDISIKKAITVKDNDEDDGGSGGLQTVTLLVDPMSFQYLRGSEIDSKQGLEGEQFVIRNPNAKTTCGCGSSFSI